MLFNYLEISRVRQFNDLDRFAFNGNFSFGIPLSIITIGFCEKLSDSPERVRYFIFVRDKTQTCSRAFRRSQRFVSAFCELIVTKISDSVTVWEVKRPARQARDGILINFYF